jgi:Alginate export
MHLRSRLPLIFALCLAAPATRAQEPAPKAPEQDAPAQPPVQDAAAQPPVQDAAPQPTPEDEQKKVIKTQFQVLKFKEDYSALGQPNVESDLWFPQIKWIELAEGWHVSFGGQWRFMEKDEVNKSLTGAFPDHNEYTLLRTRVYGDLRIQDDARVYVEGIGASIHGDKASDPPPAANDRDNWDFLNLFIDLLAPDYFLRLGRFQMSYGAERVIGPGDWANVMRTYDGGLFGFKGPGYSADFFVTHPVQIEPRSHDDPNISRHFSGVYSTMKVDDVHNADAYFLALNDDDDVVAGGNGDVRGLNIYTLGGRYTGKPAPFDYDAEVAIQRGNSSSDQVRAWMWAFVMGYTMSDLPGQPRVALDLDMASGDDNSTDGEKGTYNQLFPSTHPYFGYLDLIGRQNIKSFIPNIRWKLGDTAFFRAAWADFNLANDSDALYNTAGTATLFDPTGNSGNHIGHEWDFSLGWSPSFLAPHSSFLVGYSYLNPGNFVDHVGAGPRPQLVYFQYTFNF